MDAGPLSEWIVPGTPYVANNSGKQRIAECDNVSSQANANGNLLYSSIIVNLNLLLDNFDDGNGHSKCIDILSKDYVTQTSFPDEGLHKLGFHLLY